MTMMRNGLLVLLDQAASGASNALPLLVIARVSGAEDLGRITLLYAAIPFFLGLGRSVLGEALLASAWDRHQTGRALTFLLCGAVPVSAIGAAAYLTAGGSGILALAAVTTLPVILCQDVMRLRQIARGRPATALASDLTWLLTALGLQGAMLAGSQPSYVALFGAYLAGAVSAAVVLYALGPIRILGWSSVVQSRLPTATGVVGLSNTVAASVAFALPFLVALGAGAGALGYLQNGQLLALPVSLLATALAPVMMPRLKFVRDPRQLCSRVLAFASAGAAVLVVAVLPLVPALFPKQDGRDLRLAFLVCTVQGVCVVGATCNYLILRQRGALQTYSRVRLTWASLVLPAVVAAGILSGLVGVLVALLSASTVELALTTRSVRKIVASAA